MKLSPAQAALMHTLESAASSAILTFIVGLVQYLSTHALNWSDLATVFASGFVAAFGLIYKSVITSPNLQQAESDTLNEAVTEAKSLAQQALAHIENIWPALHGLNSALATQQAATKAATPAPSVVPVSVPQVAFTPPNTASVPFPSIVALPQRSFSQSALMPAVPKQ
jgi:hypothetical protein